MPDLLPNVQAPEMQPVDRMPVPLSRYLGASFDAGIQDSTLSHLLRIGENYSDSHDNTPMLTADEANQKYGVGDLKFNAPLHESEAQAMSDRERDKMTRDTILSNGFTKGRAIPGMVAQVAGAMANPVDLASMLIPFTEAKVAGLSVRGAIQAAKLPAPKLVESALHGALWQSTVGEIPQIIEAHQESQPYNSFLPDVLGQALFAGGLHGAGLLLGKAVPATREAMAKMAMNQWLRDDEVNVHDMLPMDAHVQAYAMHMENEHMLEQARNSINLEDIRKQLKDEKFDYPVKAAIRMLDTEEGEPAEVHTGTMHWTIPEFNTDRPIERGYMMKSGQYLSEPDMLSKMGMSDLPEHLRTSEHLIHGFFEGDDENTHMEAAEKEIYARAQDEGWSNAEITNAIRQNRQQMRERAFFNRPDIKEELQRRVDKAAQDFVDKQRQEANNPKMTQQAKDVEKHKVPVTPEEDVKKYAPDNFEKSLDDDLGTKDEEQKSPDKQGITDRVIKWIDGAIDKIDKLGNGDLFTGAFGFEPLVLYVGKPVAKGLLIALREGVKLTGNLHQGINHAMQWYHSHVSNPANVESIKSESDKAQRIHNESVEEAQSRGDTATVEKLKNAIKNKILDKVKDDPDFLIRKHLEEAVNQHMPNNDPRLTKSIEKPDPLKAIDASVSCMLEKLV